VSNYLRPRPNQANDHIPVNVTALYARLARVPMTAGRDLDRVALGRCQPRAPTDPYVLALEHTVLQIMGSLRA